LVPVEIVLAFEVKNLSTRADPADRDINEAVGSRSFGAMAGR
jgi:hypothetical protein